MQRHASPIGRKESGLAWDGSSKGTQGIGPPVQRVAQGTQGIGPPMQKIGHGVQRVAQGTQGVGHGVQRVAQGTQGVGFAKEESSPALPPRKGREK
jgi:type IV secretory pathway TrbL component